jgi:flagella basal body P-ring formation protein FlgA
MINKLMKVKILAFLLLIVMAGALKANDVVTLKDGVVQTASDKVYVKDIADVSSDDPVLKQKLEELYVKMSAVPGQRISITREKLENIIKKASPGASIEGPEKIYVLTRNTTITTDSASGKAVEYVLQHMPWKKEETEIISKSGIKELNLPEGDVELKVKEDAKINFKGNVIVPVELYVDGKLVRIVPVSLVVKVETACLVAAQEIQRGTMLTEAMVKPVKKDITYQSGNVLTDVSMAVSKTAKRGIPEGTLLLDQMFEKPSLFRRGDTVGVIVAIKGLSVETDGSVLRDGREGDIVKVKLGTGKIVEGKVNSEGKVKIEK